MTKSQASRRLDLADRLHSVAIHLLRTLRNEDLAYAAKGVSAARLSALSVVVYAGPIQLGALARAEQVTAPTMVRIVDALESLELVRRRADPEDGRAVRLEATAAGRKLMDQARRARLDRLSELLEPCQPAELGRLEKAASILETRLSRPSSSSRSSKMKKSRR